jgi:hypothetical protein
MPVMAEPAAAPPPSGPVSDDPRRLVLADLVTELSAGLIGQAAEYERAASRAAGALRQSLEDLYRAKEAEIAALAPLARDLGVTASPPPPPSGPDLSWGVVLGEAFQAERTLGRVGRELAAGAADPATRALSACLTSEIARDREEVRRLYLRYT